MSKFQTIVSKAKILLNADAKYQKEMHKESPVLGFIVDSNRYSNLIAWGTLVSAAFTKDKALAKKRAKSSLVTIAITTAVGMAVELYIKTQKPELYTKRQEIINQTVVELMSDSDVQVDFDLDKVLSKSDLEEVVAKAAQRF